MENFGFKGLLTSLYQRVIVSYKTTLIGLGFVSIDALLSYLQAVQFPAWGHYAVGLVATVFALIKQSSGIPTPIEPSRGFFRLSMLAPLAALLALVSVLASACKTMPPVVVDVLNCGESAIVKRVPDLTMQIVSILRAGGKDWQGVLLTLVDAAGEAGQCAWEVVYAQIVGGLTLTDRPREAIPSDVQSRAVEFQTLLRARTDSAKASR